MAKQLKKKKSKGQSLAEYGLIIALIAVACIAATQLLGQNISAQFNALAGQIGGVTAGMP
jgi:pilus assembly protein Flp/PilA